MTLPGNCKESILWISALPYAGIIRVRFNGYLLRLDSHPLQILTIYLNNRLIKNLPLSVNGYLLSVVQQLTDPYSESCYFFYQLFPELSILLCCGVYNLLQGKGSLLFHPMEKHVLKYDFDRIIETNNINSVKWEFMRIHAKNVNQDTLPFWIADMDFMCPPPLIEAIKDRADKLLLGYSMADEEYHEAVCNWMKRRFNWTIHASDIFISPGVVSAIKDLILCLTGNKDGIIIQNPVYYPFSAIIKHTGRTLVNNALISQDGHYEIDFEDLLQKAKDPANKMLLFCSPHNPVGRVWTDRELRQVAEICLKNEVILVADEIHFDLLRKGVVHIPLAKLFPEEDRIITCTATSKTFNTAGLQISNIIIKNKTFQQKWSAHTGPELFSPLAFAAVKAAYNESEEWLEQLLVYLDENFAFLDRYINENIPEIQFSIPQGTYLGWIDFSSYGYDDKELGEILLKKANVLLEEGTIFGPEGSGFQRINIACPRTILEQGLERIAAALHR